MMAARAPAAQARRLEAERLARGVDQLGAGRVALFLLFGQPFRQHGVELRVARKPRRLLLHVAPEHLGLGQGAEGWLSG